MKPIRLLIFLIFTAGAFAQTRETCQLQSYIGSWMKTGTPFTVKCASATYAGTIVAHPARRFFRRGSLLLKFDQPVFVEATRKNPEGEFRPGRGKQISEMALAGGSGIGSKDCLDGLSGAIFKSWMMIPVTFTAVAIFEKGGDITLKPGDPIKIVKTEVHAAE